MPWRLQAAREPYREQPTSCPECSGEPTLEHGQCATCGAMLVALDPAEGEFLTTTLIPVDATTLRPLPRRQRRTVRIQDGWKRQADGGLAKVYRLIDQQNDRYLEIVNRGSNADHHVEEPLSAHGGHGSARRRRPQQSFAAASSPATLVRLPRRETRRLTLHRMQRVLDLDLDKVVAFRNSNCGRGGPLPGFAVEHYAEVFCRWRDAIAAGLPPFHVTHVDAHVDAHADLGQGDCGYVYLLTELLRGSPEARRDPKTGDDGLGDGNYLAFAIANRWISELTYVIGGRYEDLDEGMDYEWQPGDLLPYLFENFDLWTRTFRLPTLERRNLLENLSSTERLRPLELEPAVPFRWMVCHEFRAPKPFDVICLARSPAFTPEAADSVYEEIRGRFIDEAAMTSS